MQPDSGLLHWRIEHTAFTLFPLVGERIENAIDIAPRSSMYQQQPSADTPSRGKRDIGHRGARPAYLSFGLSDAAIQIGNE
jgi:hypothetical protein